MRLLGYSLLLAFVLVGSSFDPSSVHADERRVVQYTFPTPVTGVDLGRDTLVRYIEKEDLSASDVVDYLFDRIDLTEMSNVLRTRILGAELALLDAELRDFSLTSAVNSSASDTALAAKLKEEGVSESELVRGLRDVFEDFYPKEVAAYWVQQGFNETYFLARLKRNNEADRRYRKIEDYIQDDLDRPTYIWRDQVRDWVLRDQLEFYLGLAGRPDQTEIEKIFEEEDKILTPELLRILEFGDPELASLALTQAGIKPRTFYDSIEDLFDAKERNGSGVQTSNELIERLNFREDALTDWLRTRGKDVEAVYQGRIASFPSFPALGKLEGESNPSKLPDFGISLSLASYFSAAPDITLVLYQGSSVRAIVNGVRYEGYYDTHSGSLDLIAVYGGSDIRLRDLALHGSGLFLEASIADAQPDKARFLLRRTRRY